MRPRLLADENTSRRMVEACRRLDAGFPIIHIADWRKGEWLGANDEDLLNLAQQEGLILVTFDRRTLAHEAGKLTRSGGRHAGVILFRGMVGSVQYGRQAQLLLDIWSEAASWNWSDLVIYLPRA